MQPRNSADVCMYVCVSSYEDLAAVQQDRCVLPHHHPSIHSVEPHVEELY